jgi:SAM-dependent methyltransferase
MSRRRLEQPWSFYTSAVLLDGCACPFCHAILTGTECPSHGRVVEVDGNRAAWDTRAAALAEAETWDAWAAARTGVNVRMDVPGWLNDNRTTRRLRRRFPKLANPSGWRMLDIGGTCRDSIRFLRSNAARVDQVEVSAGSQALAIVNLETSGIDDWPERVFFHTVAAETLPFADDTFDLVFSRATIHHTDRARSVPELHRVLNPGGLLLLVEAYLSPLMQPLMRARRQVARDDRGTDRPLSRADLALIREWFPGLWVYQYNVVWLPWSQTLHKTRWGHALTPRVWRLDLALGRMGGLAWLLGQQCLVGATKG